MTTRPRLTVTIQGNAGGREVVFYLNPAAREHLIAQLQKLDRSDDHFHVLGAEVGDELQLSSLPYEPDDELAAALKFCLRYDDWDIEHYPHVMDPASGASP